MLLCRYSNIEFVYNLHWIEGLEIIKKANEKIKEQKDWEVWLAIYPTMDNDTYISFDDFRGKSKKSEQSKSNKPKLSQNEILAKADEIKRLHQGTHEGVKE